MKLSKHRNSKNIHILSLMGLIILTCFIIIIPSQSANMNVDTTPTPTEATLISIGAVSPIYTTITIQIRFTVDWFLIRFMGDTPASLDGLSLRRVGSNRTMTPSEDFGLLIGKLANPNSCYFYTENGRVPDNGSISRGCDSDSIDAFLSDFWTQLDTIDVYWHGELAGSCPVPSALDGCLISSEVAVTPSPTPTNTVTFTPTPTETLIPSPTPTETVTLTPTPTETVTPSPTPTETFTPTLTNTPEPPVCPSTLPEGMICIPAGTYRPKQWRNIDNIMVIDTEIIIEQPFIINQYPIEYTLFTTFLLNHAYLTVTPSHPLSSPSLMPIPLPYAATSYVNAGNYCDFTYIGELPTQEQLLVAYYHEQYKNFPSHGQSVHREWTSELTGQDAVILIWDSEKDIFDSNLAWIRDASRVPIYFRCVFQP